jgi:hypothetical protein
MVIDSSAQWWRLVDQNWDDLATLFKRHDLGGELPNIERMKRHRDVQIARRLQIARKRAPHRREAKRDRSWQLLFDLCAEQWVLHQPVA